VDDDDDDDDASSSASCSTEKRHVCTPRSFTVEHSVASARGIFGLGLVSFVVAIAANAALLESRTNKRASPLCIMPCVVGYCVYLCEDGAHGKVGWRVQLFEIQLKKFVTR
jgi:hypothetical protein